MNGCVAADQFGEIFRSLRSRSRSARRAPFICMWRRILAAPPTHRFFSSLHSRPRSLALSSFWSMPSDGEGAARLASSISASESTAETEESLSKRTKMALTIGTHDGTFHCDEALAVYMLRHTEKFKDAQLFRTREADVLKGLDIVVDVGGEFDSERLRFDHHQRGFNRTLDALGASIKLSSAGLVYEQFGMDVLKFLAKKNGLTINDEDWALLYHKMYFLFVQEIDAIDNGVQMYDDNGGTLKPRYKIGSHISVRVARLNPAWNAPEEKKSREAVNQAFEKGSALVGGEMEEVFVDLATEWLPARQIVVAAYNDRFEVDSSGKIIKLEEPCFWKEHLHDIEKKNESDAKVLYVLYTDAKSTGLSWRIQAVPLEPGSFASRKALPEPWCGVRDSNLDELLDLSTAKDGAIFVHASGFIGGHRTYEGALEMAIKAIGY